MEILCEINMGGQNKAVLTAISMKLDGPEPGQIKDEDIDKTTGEILPDKDKPKPVQPRQQPVQLPPTNHKQGLNHENPLNGLPDKKARRVQRAGSKQPSTKRPIHKRPCNKRKWTNKRKQTEEHYLNGCLR